MLPSVNNVICIVYDEIKSNMKGVLLYVVHPSDAQLIRDDFRVVKQANNAQSHMSYASSAADNSQIYSPIRSPLLNNTNIRQPSPRRAVYVRENESNSMYPQITYTPVIERRRHRSPKKHRSPSKRSTDSVISKENRRHKSRSPEKQLKTKLPVSRSSPELAKQEIQQLAAMQAQQQQMPTIPMGIYNR